MKKLILFYILFPFACMHAQEVKEVRKNGMQVNWYYEGLYIHFIMEAPSAGWLAIGIHENETLHKATLYMGCVKENLADISEHFTFSPGNYKSYKELGFESQLKIISGKETATHTMLHFTVPIKAFNKYHKNLNQNKTYYMTLAYSRSDDYKHHSMMRNSIKIKL